MKNHSNKDQGIKLLIEKCRNDFRRKENIDFYSDEDYKASERKFVKLCLIDKT